MLFLAYLPSPSRGVWHLGPFPVRAYALSILAGIGVAIWLTGRRWAARGGDRHVVGDIAVWAVPFGVAGGRLYHVLTDPELYFSAGRPPIRALYIWDGGLGIPGAVALGAVGAWIGCRRHGIRLADFADAAAPGIVLAQAIGRWGSYFNQELYGRPSHLPWALLIDPAHRPAATPGIALYQPAVLYESLWDLGTAALLVWLDPVLRVDHANHLLGLRLNDWTSAVLILGAVASLLISRGRGRPRVVPDPGSEAAETPGADCGPAVG